MRVSCARRRSAKEPLRGGGQWAMAPTARVFADRAAAGAALAREMQQRSLRPPVRVLALPRGGVPVAYEVARALDAPLDVMLVRKVGMPGQPELALGAVAAREVTVRQSPGGGDFEP